MRARSVPVTNLPVSGSKTLRPPASDMLVEVADELRRSELVDAFRVPELREAPVLVGIEDLAEIARCVGRERRGVGPALRRIGRDLVPGLLAEHLADHRADAGHVLLEACRLRSIGLVRRVHLAGDLRLVVLLVEARHVHALAWRIANVAIVEPHEPGDRPVRMRVDPVEAVVVGLHPPGKLQLLRVRGIRHDLRRLEGGVRLARRIVHVAE